jgi:hypothetical protein
MSNDDFAWQRYADLQERSRKVTHLGDYAWGIERALNYLLNAIKTGTVPPNPLDLDAALNRAIASGARLHRSRSLALKKSMTPPESVSIGAAALASIELTKIARAFKTADNGILIDAGFGYTDREIAERHASTPGAVRVRLHRLRLKLTAGSHPTNPAGGSETTYHVHAVQGSDPQPANYAAR